MNIYNNFLHARNEIFREIKITFLNELKDVNVFDDEHRISYEELKKRVEIIDNLLRDKKFIKKHSHDFFENEHYLPHKKDSLYNAVGFSFTIEETLRDLRANLLNAKVS